MRQKHPAGCAEMPVRVSAGERLSDRVVDRVAEPPSAQPATPRECCGAGALTPPQRTASAVTQLRLRNDGSSHCDAGGGGRARSKDATGSENFGASTQGKEPEMGLEPMTYRLQGDSTDRLNTPVLPANRGVSQKGRIGNSGSFRLIWAGLRPTGASVGLNDRRSSGPCALARGHVEAGVIRPPVETLGARPTRASRSR
jgi:hypothetical protein